MNGKENNQRPVTADCGVEGLAHLKTFHHIPDFRIGGTYNLDDPASWESGGRGGTTLESLGEGPLRTACITAARLTGTKTATSTTPSSSAPSIPAMQA